jgi:hypothetical protein
MPNPLTRLLARVDAWVWGLRGRRRLRRGDARGAIRAYELARRRRGPDWTAAMRLAVGHLCAREVAEARRWLTEGREVDPVRYDREAALYLARHGFDLEAVQRLPAAPRRAGPAVGATLAPRARHVAASLPFGDCLDLDEYARFSAMPPITRSEAATIDWDQVIEDLLED